jgi:hypothetical protein
MSDIEGDRLYDELEAAIRAWKSHLDSGIVVWRGGGPPPRTPGRTVDMEWLAESERLRAQRDSAEQAILDYYTGRQR